MTEPKILLVKSGRTAASTAEDQISALNLPDTAVTPGEYTSANITIDQKGRITSATNGASLPSGGATGDILVKNSATDFDYGWTDSPEPVLVVTQADHLFEVLDIVRPDGPNWVKALAPNGLGVVVEVVSTDVFKVGFNGVFDIPEDVSLVPNTFYYVSDTVAGALTDEEPRNSQPILLAMSTTKVYVNIFRGFFNSFSGSQIKIEQTAHGFDPLQTIRPSSGNWVTALAPEALAVVTEVVDANTFMIGVSGVYKVTNSLTANQVYYASSTLAGAITTQEPDDYSQPILFAIDAETVYINVFRPAKRPAIEQVLYKVEDVDLTDTATDYLLFTVPSGKLFFFQELLVITKTIDTPVDLGEISLRYGTPTPYYYLENEPLPALVGWALSQRTYWTFNTSTVNRAAFGGEDVLFSTTNTDATAFTADIIVKGYLQ